MRGRLDALEIELRDHLDVVEHPGELGSHALDLVLAEGESGEPGDVQNLFSVDHAWDSGSSEVE